MAYERIREVGSLKEETPSEEGKATTLPNNNHVSDTDVTFNEDDSIAEANYITNDSSFPFSDNLLSESLW